jgi:hypothetical protein
MFDIQPAFTSLIFFLFIIESVVFLYMNKKNQVVDNKYYIQYKKYNPTLFTAIKLLFLSVIVISIYFPSSLAARSIKLGAYIAGILYCMVALNFLWSCLYHIKKTK